MPSSPHGKWATTMFSLAPSLTSPINSSTNTETYLQTSNLAEAMLITSGRQARAKEMERAKAKAADLAASCIGTKMKSRQTNAHAQITIRSAQQCTSLSMTPLKDHRTTRSPSALAHLHDQARQWLTRYMAATRLHRSTAIPIRNCTTTATTTDGTYPTPDQNAESCQTTHPTPEPKRKPHLPRIPPLWETMPSNQYAPMVANVPSSGHGDNTAIDYNLQGPTSPRHPRPTSLLHYLQPRVSSTIATQSPVLEHRVFSIYSPTVTFTSDSGATDILMR
jgi:hypothetical protein